jgi:DNA-binding MarR family transcriptional regulator
MIENTQLASALRTATSHLFKRLRQQINTVDNLSLTEITTLSNLYNHQPLFPSQMAEMVKIKAQSMSQIINKLEEANLIVKIPSATDKRKVAISLSDFGKKMVDDTRHDRDEWLNEAIDNCLSAPEKKLLEQAVVVMEKLIAYK